MLHHISFFNQATQLICKLELCWNTKHSLKRAAIDVMFHNSFNAHLECTWTTFSHLIWLSFSNNCLKKIKNYIFSRPQCTKCRLQRGTVIQKHGTAQITFLYICIYLVSNAVFRTPKHFPVCYLPDKIRVWSDEESLQSSKITFVNYTPFYMRLPYIIWTCNYVTFICFCFKSKCYLIFDHIGFFGDCWSPGEL